LRGIAIRQNLTDEWKERGIESERDFAILTAEISKKEKPDTFDKSKTVARRGGRVAGTAREETEKELGRSIVTEQNFLPEKSKSGEKK
jgi:hypothetical protein